MAPGSHSPHPTISATWVNQESQNDSQRATVGIERMGRGEAGAAVVMADLRGACSVLTWSIVGYFPETGLS